MMGAPASFFNNLFHILCSRTAQVNIIHTTPFFYSPKSLIPFLFKWTGTCIIKNSVVERDMSLFQGGRIYRQHSTTTTTTTMLCTDGGDPAVWPHFDKPEKRRFFFPSPFFYPLNEHICQWVGNHQVGLPGRFFFLILGGSKCARPGSSWGPDNRLSGSKVTLVRIEEFFFFFSGQ